MGKTVLTSEQIQQEVYRRMLLQSPISSEQADIVIPLPKAHAVDAHARNWDMEDVGHTGYGGYIRRVIDEARKEFLLSDSAERDEILADSFAHS